MSKHHFYTQQRWALWLAYSKRCAYCQEPILWRELAIDHILPKTLLNHPDEWAKLRDDYGLVENFNLNDYENWYPAHTICNLRKGKTRFQKAAALFYLQVAREKASKARQFEARMAKDERADDLFRRLEAAVEQRTITADEIIAFVDSLKFIPLAEPLVVCFGLNVHELLEEDALPEDAPDWYPDLCDWLENELKGALKRLFQTPFHYPEPSARNGETLSARIVFEELDFNSVASRLANFNSAWWKIIEVAYFRDIYGVRYNDSYRETGLTP